MNEQILRRINANFGLRLGHIEHPMGTLDLAMRGRDADNEHVNMVIAHVKMVTDRGVRVRRAFAFVAVPGEDDDISRYSRRHVPPFEKLRPRPLRPRGVEPLPGGGVGRQQLEFLRCGLGIARLVEHSICSQREFVAQARTSRDYISERAACLTRQVGDGVWSRQ